MSFFVVDEVKRAAAGTGCGLIITQDNIPLIINKPGKYSLAEDITNITGTAITVAANEVCLDLNCRTVRGGFIGIEVRPDIQNVTIQNGSVLSTASTGILIDPRCSAITVDNITANSHGLIGIDVQQDSKDISLLNSSFDYSKGAGMVIRSGVSSLFIDSSSGSFNGPLGVKGPPDSPREVAGLLVDGIPTAPVFDITIKNSQFSGNAASAPGLSAHGCDLNQAYRISVENCISSSVVSLNGEAFGLTFGSVIGDIDVSNCLSQGHVGRGWVHGATFGATSSKATIRNLVVKDLLALQTTFSGISWGILVQGGGSSVVEMHDCTVQGIQTSQGTVSDIPFGNLTLGYMLSGIGDTSLVENCVVEDISAPSSVVGGFMVIDPRFVVLRNCEAIRITNTATLVTGTIEAFGFNAGGISNISRSPIVIFENCVAENVTFPAAPDRAFGFLIQNSINSSCVNCMSHQNGQGFRLDTPYVTNIDPVNCMVEGCLAYVNTVAGFVDTSATATANVFTRNLAYKNAGLNYTRNLATFGLSANTPIRTWSYSFGLPPAKVNNFGEDSDPFDNLSID